MKKFTRIVIIHRAVERATRNQHMRLHSHQCALSEASPEIV